MGKIKDNWQLAVFTVVITILGSGVWTYFQNRDKSIDGAATIEYVDKQHEDQKIYIDEQDKHIWTEMNRIENVQQTKVDQNEFDKLYNLVIENNKLSIEILKEINQMK